SASRRRSASPVLATCIIGLSRKERRSSSSKLPSLISVPVSGCHMKRRPTISGCSVRTNTVTRHSGTPAAVMRWHSSVSTSCDSGALRAPWTSHSTTGCSESGGGIIASPEIQVLEEVVAFVVDDEEGGEIAHLNAQDRFHAELGIFDAFDFLDAILGKIRGGSADRGEIKPAVLLASLAHDRGTIAFGQRHHRATGSLELVGEGIHAPGSGRPERTRRIALRRLGRPGVIDRMVLEIIRQGLAALQPFAQLGLGEV